MCVSKSVCAIMSSNNPRPPIILSLRYICYKLIVSRLLFIQAIQFHKESWLTKRQRYYDNIYKVATKTGIGKTTGYLYTNILQNLINECMQSDN